MRHASYLYLFIGTILLLSGCAATSSLQKDTYLLSKQQVKGTQKVSKRTLAKYYQQQSNSKWLGIPFLLWVYRAGRHSFDEAAIQQRIAQIEVEFDTKIAAVAGNLRKVERLQREQNKKLKKQAKRLKEGNVLMRFGEPPEIYNPQQRTATEQRFLAYLHARGYFNAQVRSTLKLYQRKAVITYYVEENEPYVLGESRISTSDNVIEKLLQDHQQESLLKKGDSYDQEVLRQERERIYLLLSNHGYFSFNRQYIRFEVDATSEDFSVIVKTVVDMPENGQAHPIAYIDHVAWSIDTDQSEEATQGQNTYHHNGIIFKNLKRRFKPSLLASKLAFVPLQLYRKQDLVEAQRRLYRLDMFKHIHISYDILDGNKLVPCIDTTPADRFQITSELGLQISYGYSLPKPFYQLSLRGRNLFKSLETLELATHIGVEGTAASTPDKGFVDGQVYGVDLSVSWPQFLLPMKAVTHTNLEQFYPVSKLSLGYEFIQHLTYTQDILTSFIRYDWKDKSRGAYEFTPLRIELINTRRIEDAFQEKLKTLQQLKTFEPSLVSLTSFKGSLRRESASGRSRASPWLEFFFESGGILQNFIDLRKSVPALSYYQYIKFNVGCGQRIPVCSSAVLAYCVNTGVAYAYGAEKILPHGRYYFMGSTNGMRAWPPRSLGPGTYSPPPNNNDRRVEGQFGELLLQGSVELRQQLVGFLEGACFVDVGNIWTLHDHACLDEKFSIRNFYKEIAIGTGIGFRFNFRLLILRLDMGLKLYDPARPLGKRFVGNRILSDQPVFSIGIDYPF